MPRAADSISTTLLGRVRETDPRAWNQLVALFGPLIYHWARKSNLSEADAADIVQEVFIAVHGRIGSFEREMAGGTFRGWLRQITRFKVCDCLRRQATQPIAEGGTDAHIRMEATTDVLADDSDCAGEIAGLTQRALDMIRPDFTESTWRAFQLSALEGRPMEDVARELNLSIGAVYVARSRVRQRLREELENLF